MSAGVYDLLIEQGTDWLQPVTFKNPDGTPTNLTGYTARMQVRKTNASGPVVIDSTSGSPNLTCTIPAPTTGTVLLTMTAAQTAVLVPNLPTPVLRGSRVAYVYDLELVDGAGVVQRVLQGAVNISPEVTK